MNGNLTSTDPLAAERRWPRFAMRGVKVAGCCVVIAVCLWATVHDDLGKAIVYSLCIGLMCWLFIDLGGDIVGAWIAIPSSPSVKGLRGWLWTGVVVLTGAVLGYASGNEIANALTGLHEPGPFNAGTTQIKTVLAMALVPAMAITYFLTSREIIATQRAEVEAAQRQAAEQQLKLLESQLEPHMLFNTLANLRALIGIDPPRAQVMLDQLIAFLRSSLDGSRARMHPLAAEFQRLRDYLALMQIRMGARLQTHLALPPSLADALVPPLLLQPLAENSIKHGLEPNVAGGRIDISAADENGVLVLRVRDTGIGLDAATVGDVHYGLAHVRERLATLYGERASFVLAPDTGGGGGTLATIRMPLQRVDLSGPAARA